MLNIDKVQFFPYHTFFHETKNARISEDSGICKRLVSR